MRQNVEQIEVSLIVVSFFDDVRIIGCEDVESTAQVLHCLTFDVVVRCDSSDLSRID